MPKSKSLIVLAVVGILVTIVVVVFTVSPVSRARFLDFISQTVKGNDLCDRFLADKQSLVNIADKSELEKEYGTLEEAIASYPWQTQYLPVADIYCNLPWNVQRATISGEVKQSQQEYNVVVEVVEGAPYNQTYNSLVSLQFNPQSNKYRVTSVRWYLPL